MTRPANRYSILVVLTATCVLWITRVVLPGLQYGMWAVFVGVALGYLVALGLMLAPGGGA